MPNFHEGLIGLKADTRPRTHIVARYPDTQDILTIKAAFRIILTQRSARTGMTARFPSDATTKGASEDDQSYWLANEGPLINLIQQRKYLRCFFDTAIARLDLVQYWS